MVALIRNNLWDRLTVWLKPLPLFFYLGEILRSRREPAAGTNRGAPGVLYWLLVVCVVFYDFGGF